MTVKVISLTPFLRCSCSSCSSVGFKLFVYSFLPVCLGELSPDELFFSSSFFFSMDLMFSRDLISFCLVTSSVGWRFSSSDLRLALEKLLLLIYWTTTKGCRLSREGWAAWKPAWIWWREPPSTSCSSCPRCARLISGLSRGFGALQKVSKLILCSSKAFRIMSPPVIAGEVMIWPQSERSISVASSSSSAA